MPVKWKVADRSSNRFFEAIEAEYELFIKVRTMSFLGKLVKNQTEVSKYWPWPPVVARTGEGSSIVLVAQIGEPSGTGSAPRVSLFFFFESLP